MDDIWKKDASKCTEKLKVNGEPLEFFLHEFDTFTNYIYKSEIERNGAKCTENPTENTIFLVLRKPSKDLVYDIYNAEYINDCLKEEKVLEKEKYRIPRIDELPSKPTSPEKKDNLCERSLTDSSDSELEFYSEKKSVIAEKKIPMIPDNDLIEVSSDDEDDFWIPSMRQRSLKEVGTQNTSKSGNSEKNNFTQKPQENTVNSNERIDPSEPSSSKSHESREIARKNSEKTVNRISVAKFAKLEKSGESLKQNAVDSLSKSMKNEGNGAEFTEHPRENTTPLVHNIYEAEYINDCSGEEEEKMLEEEKFRISKEEKLLLKPISPEKTENPCERSLTYSSDSDLEIIFETESVICEKQIPIIPNNDVIEVSSDNEDDFWNTSMRQRNLREARTQITSNSGNAEENNFTQKPQENTVNNNERIDLLEPSSSKSHESREIAQKNSEKTVSRISVAKFPKLEKSGESSKQNAIDSLSKCIKIEESIIPETSSESSDDSVWIKTSKPVNIPLQSQKLKDSDSEEKPKPVVSKSPSPRQSRQEVIPKVMNQVLTKEPRKMFGKVVREISLPSSSSDEETPNNLVNKFKKERSEIHEQGSPIKKQRTLRKNKSREKMVISTDSEENDEKPQILVNKRKKKKSEIHKQGSPIKKQQTLRKNKSREKLVISTDSDDECNERNIKILRSEKKVFPTKRVGEKIKLESNSGEETPTLVNKCKKKKSEDHEQRTPIEKQQTLRKRKKSREKLVIKTDKDDEIDEKERNREKIKLEPKKNSNAICWLDDDVLKFETDYDKSTPDRMANCKFLVSKRFQTWEVNEMIRYLYEHQNFERGRSVTVWNEMRNTGLLPHRTGNSLKQCFNRYILKNFEKYVPDVELRNIIFDNDKFKKVFSSKIKKQEEDSN